MPTTVSFQTMRAAFDADSSRVASARTATVRVCVAALPPIEATIGMSTASATTASMVASNSEMTVAARNAVQMFTASQVTRERAVAKAARSRASLKSDGGGKREGVR